MKYLRLHRYHSGSIAISLAIIAFFMFGLAVMALLNFYIPKETQTIESRAQTLSPIQEAKCINAGGECQTGMRDRIGQSCTLTDGTSGIVYFDYCPSQGDDIRCCAPNDLPDPGEGTAEYRASLVVKLQGIEANQIILNDTRTATIKIFDSSGIFDSADYAATDILTYDPESGNFTNSSFSLGELAAGEYQMVIQMQNYLDEQLLNSEESGIFVMSAGASVETKPITLRAGDLAPGERGDNFINILDYNLLWGCMPEAPAGSCLNRDRADINDDGIVDQEDMDILLENYNNKGFAFKTDKFQCEQDPACESGRDSLQLCSLLCTRVSRRS